MAIIRIKQGKQSSQLETASIQIGVHNECALSLEDRVASARHARIDASAAGFALADLGSATGTWLNGVEVVSPQLLHAGDAFVVGCSRIVVAGLAEGVLELEVDSKPFFFEPSSSHKNAQGKLVVGGDGERLVRDEVKFSRLRGLKPANLFALAVSCLAVAALLAPAVRDEVLSPGPLASPHASLFDTATAGTMDPWHAKHREVAGEQGCSACHDTMGGTPPDKCAQCHEELVEQNHPFFSDRSANPATASIVLDEDTCASCHMDHSGPEPESGVFIPRPEDLTKSCARCHANAVPELQRKPTQFAAVPHELSYDRFPHAAHAEQRCDTCHVRDATAGPLGSDFGAVPFATCMGCHSADAVPSASNAWPRDPALSAWSSKVKPEHQVRLAWHGSGAKDDAGNSKCLACHAQERTAALKTTLVDEPASLVYQLKRRAHAELFAADTKVELRHAGSQACVACHASGSVTHGGETKEGTFQHAVHLSTVSPADPAATAESNVQCQSCHAELNTAAGLSGGAEGGSYKGPALTTCEECHREERNGVVEALVLAVQAKGDAQRRERIEFPHAVHMQSVTWMQSGPLADGCYSCHEFDNAQPNFDAQPRTKPEASNCIACHADHAHVGGSQATGCELCHAPLNGQADPVWSGAKSVRMRPATRGFSHWSRGHAGSMERAACTDCHGNAAEARTVGEMQIPSESDSACFECHLRERFHWRGAPAKH